MRRIILSLLIPVFACTSDKSNTETRPDTTDTTEEVDTSEDTGRDDTADTAEDVADTTEDTEDTGDVDEDIADTSDATEDIADTSDATEDIADTTDDTGDTTTAACEAAEDCENCTYGQPVASEADCYCPLCPTHPLSREACVANEAGWQAHCTGWAEVNPCPVARCILNAAPICSEAGECVADPNACRTVDDCQLCAFTQAPKSPADCACPGCPTPSSATSCEEVELAVLEHCGDFDFDACLPPPCARPPELACTSAGVCGYEELLEPR